MKLLHIIITPFRSESCLGLHCILERAATNVQSPTKCCDEIQLLFEIHEEMPKSKTMWGEAPTTIWEVVCRNTDFFWYYNLKIVYLLQCHKQIHHYKVVLALMSNSHSKSWFCIPLKASYNHSIVSFHIKWKTTDKRQWMLKVISKGIKPGITWRKTHLYDKNTYVCVLYSSLYNYERYYSQLSFQISDNRFGAINLAYDLQCVLIKTLSITFHMWLVTSVM